MLRIMITEKITDITRTLNRGMLISYTHNFNDDTKPNTQGFPGKERNKWAYSRQSSFFLDTVPVT